MLRQGLAAVLFLLILPFSAYADFLIEPYGGGQFSGTTSAASGSSFSSFVFGGRLGLEYSGFSFGGEYLGDRNVDVKVGGPNTWGSNSTSLSMNDNDYGAFLAYEFMQPLAIRLVATYFIASQSHLVHNNGTTNDTDEMLTGSGYKGEIQARLARYLMLGVAYYYMQYPKSHDNLTGDTTSTSPEDSSHAVMATISIPLRF